jgi:hypothetical protein
MFLNKNYILANELIQKMNINIANISVIVNHYEDGNDFTTMFRMNNCTMINSASQKLPKNLRDAIAVNEFTDITNKLPCTFVRSEYEFTEKELIESNIVIDKIEISGKKFYVFDRDFVEKVKNKIVYALDASETMECFRKKQIEGYIQVSKNKYLTWY